MKLFSLLVLIIGINMISVHRGKTHCKKWCSEVRATEKAMWVAHNRHFNSDLETRDADEQDKQATYDKYVAALQEARDCSCRSK